MQVETYGWYKMKQEHKKTCKVTCVFNANADQNISNTHQLAAFRIYDIVSNESDVSRNIHALQRKFLVFSCVFSSLSAVMSHMCICNLRCNCSKMCCVHYCYDSA